ncbi:hypothetical protein F5Y12DRAFT_705818 [Xylaria sp. FL1777]|nr:hypothetical protein F5Y12DRAFT_705818 [Xylaria sp. FL1777]
MTVPESAAAQFASIEELLLMLAEHVDDQGTLWSLCLSNRRFNRVFASKLSERIIIRIGNDDDEATIQSIADNLVAGPYLRELRHLQIIIAQEEWAPPGAMEMVMTLLSYTASLKIFTWQHFNADIPIPLLTRLDVHCPQLKELHLHFGPICPAFMTGVFGMPPFESLRVFTCRGAVTKHALNIMLLCPNLETVKMTEMEGTLAVNHYLIKLLISRREASCSPSRKLLKMDICSWCSSRTTHSCEICDSPRSRSYNPDDDRCRDVWPWPLCRARRYFDGARLTHITYEYPCPEPQGLPAIPLDD